MSETEKTGWFRHKISGQIFEAEGHQYAEALKNRDLEPVNPPKPPPKRRSGVE